MTTIRCHFCRKTAWNVFPATGVQVCGYCLTHIRNGDWLALAKSWISNHPDDWVDDVAAFIEHGLIAGSTNTEKTQPMSICHGCADSSETCDKPHWWKRVLLKSTVVAQNPKDRRK
jgi:hypothetical protein